MPDESFDAFVSPELEIGVNAEALAAWHSPHQLTLDFLVPLDDGGRTVVASRVRIPVTAALGVLGSLSEAVRNYELEYGEIHRPRRRGEE